MEKTLGALLVALLAGCATQPEMVWNKPGSTQQDFYMDQGQCRAQGFSVAGGNLYQVVAVFQSCMQGKGWYMEPRT